MNSPFRDRTKPRVLIVALSGIGNLLMQSVLWTTLKKENPRADISLMLARRGTRDIVEQNNAISAAIPGSGKPSFHERINMIQHVRRGHFDVGIVAYPGQLAMSSSLLFFGSVPERIGHQYHYHVLHNTGLFLTAPVEEQQVHDVEQNAALLAPLGIHPDVKQFQYDFPLDADDASLAQTWQTQHGFAGARAIGIHPGSHANMQYKRWPVEHWVALSKMLWEMHQSPILVFGGTDEQAIQEEVVSRIGSHAHAVQLPLRATAALIRTCTLFVSNDSGLMHIAASQRVPTFGLFGPTDERRTAPWGPYGHVIRAHGTSATYAVADARALRDRREPDETLIALKPEDVRSAIESAMENQR